MRLADLTLEPGWQSTADAQPPVVHAFHEDTGPTTPLQHTAYLIDVISLIFGDDFFGKSSSCSGCLAAALAFV